MKTTTKSLSINELSKTVTGKNGLPLERAIAYAFIRENNLMDKFMRNHDRNYTNCTTEELQKFCNREDKLIINRANREAIKAAAKSVTCAKSTPKVVGNNKGKSVTEAVLDKAKGVVRNMRKSTK